MPFEDTVLLDTPLTETQLENLCFDTELEGNMGCVVENLSAAALCGYGEEVVLDSEGEEVQGSKVANGAVDGKAGRGFKGNVLDLEKEQLSSAQKQVDDVVADSDDSDCEKTNAGNEVSSIDFRSNGWAKNPSHSPDCDQNFPRLNYVGSREPGELSQANALDFVDHFLSVNNVNSSPGVNHRKTVVRVKSPPFSSAKGPQSLAKRIQLRTPIVKAGTFEWTDSDQHGEGEFFSKRMEASFDFGSCRQISVTRDQEDRNLHSKGGSSLVHEHKENNEFPDLHKEMMVATCSDSRSALRTSKEVSSTVKVIENSSVMEFDDQLDASLTGQQLESSDIGRDTFNMFDIGFSTQVAAEAMEALACGPPAGFSYGDDFQGPENTIDHSPRGVIRNEAHLGHSSFQEIACSDRGNIARNSKRRKRSARRLTRGSSDTFHIQYENKELDLESAITTKVKGGKSSVERQLHCGNSADTNESSGRRSDKSTKQRNAKGSSGGTKLKEFEIDRCTSFSGEHILFGKGQSQGKRVNLSHVAHRTRQWMSEDKLVRTKDQLDNPGERMNDGGIIQYRRKRSRLAADPVEVLRTKDQLDNPGERMNDGGIIQYRRKMSLLAADPVEVLRTKDQLDNPGERMNDGGLIQYRRKRSRLAAGPVEVLRTKDQLYNPGERMNDGGIIQYRRKRSRLAADPVAVLSAREKCSKLDFNSSLEAGHNKLNRQDQSVQEVTGIASYLRSNPWRYPRGKRTCRNVRCHSNGPNNIYAPFATIDGKESIVHYARSQKRSEDNDELQRKAGSSVYTCPHWRSSENDSDGSLLGKNFDELGSRGVMSNCESAVINTKMFPTGLCRARASVQPGNLDGKDSTSFADGEKNHKLEILPNKSIEPSGFESTVTFSSIKGINVAAANCMFSDYHRKPCNKNLPKSSLVKELIRIRAPESLPDLTWKDLRRRRDMSSVQVLFSQHLDNNIIKQQKKIVARLGISVASCCRDATHFIADKFARTRNMLEAIALGKHVVTYLWLESCGQASCLIDEKNYILRDIKKEKEIGFSMPVSLARASQHPLLKGQRVLITPSIKPDREMITSLVKAVHGQLVERSQISAGKDERFLEDLLILSCEEDHAICRPFLVRGATVYSSELLVNGIVIQKLEYERHELFTNQVKRKHSTP